jgi:hypothetical protein
MDRGEQEADERGDHHGDGPWHGPAFVIMVLFTAVALGALLLHRQTGTSTGAPTSGSGPGTTLLASGAPVANGPTTTLVSVPGFATAQDYLACVRQAESDGEYSVVSPSGLYFGAYQIDQTTWNNTVLHAGLTSLYDVQPNEATPASQDEVAMALLQWQGTSPWAGDC